MFLVMFFFLEKKECKHRWNKIGHKSTIIENAGSLYYSLYFCMCVGIFHN